MYLARDLLKEVLARAGVDPSAPETKIYRVWDEIIGVELAGHATLREVDHRRLIVEVDHPAWLQLIQMHQRKIIERLNTKFPALSVERIHVIICNNRTNQRESIK